MVDVKALLTKICDALKVDYIVSTGTSSGWYYRKWNSGRCEAWCGYSVGSVAITTASPNYGGYRSLAQSAPIPSGLFNVTPTVIGQRHTSQGGWLANCYATSTTNIEFFYSSTISQTITSQYVALYAFGTWK